MRKLSHTRGVMTKNFNIRLQNVLFPFLTNVEFEVELVSERLKFTMSCRKTSPFHEPHESYLFYISAIKSSASGGNVSDDR